ncbi:MAG: outer rane assembly lipoprotein YfiO [Myxococcales bacterium]|nr:outer rane assembly lipoprotein YfiO [Myxococcales bacterium]
MDGDATLTYHSFAMSPPFPRAVTFASSRSTLALVVVSLLALASADCATSEEATKPITYSLTAKQNYEKGIAELKDENYPEAQKYFQFVKQKYPFSKYAVLAELAIADSHFERGNYTDAIDSYKAFARLHPTHEKVEDGYCAFRIGESYFKDMPDDIWILPPSYEKDQSAVSDALRELNDFAKKFPDSKYLKKGEELRRQVQQRLVDHEVYVARFYLRGDHPKAAAMRLETALRRYPGSGRDPELLLALGETYLNMGDPRRAKETFKRIVDEFPTAPDARRSALYLEFITKRFGEDPPTLTPTTPAPTASEPASSAHG